MEVVGKVIIRWERNNEPVTTSNEVIIIQDDDDEKRRELLFENLKTSDFGEYVCIAQNEVGTAFEVFTLMKQGLYMPLKKL